MIKKYDRYSAVNYALKYAIIPNPKFYNFENIGGDCTNFISQCVYAGSGIMNYNYTNGWYYISTNNRSPSWTSVNHFQKFTLNNLSNGPFGIEISQNNVEIGDIIQLKQGNVYNHSLIITKIDNSKIYISTHSTNEVNRPLSSYNYNEIKFIKILGVNI